jgi:hypothetical protein
MKDPTPVTISFENANTGEVYITSRYVGRFGFNGIDDALDLVFKDLNYKLHEKLKER